MAIDFENQLDGFSIQQLNVQKGPEAKLYDIPIPFSENAYISSLWAIFTLQLAMECRRV